MEDLKGKRIHDSEKAKILDILKHFEMDNEEKPVDLESLNEDELWKLLSESDRAKFQEMIESGEILSFMDPWKPWWEEIISENIEGDEEFPPIPLIDQAVLQKSSKEILFNISQLW